MPSLKYEEIPLQQAGVFAYIVEEIIDNSLPPAFNRVEGKQGGCQSADGTLFSRLFPGTCFI